MGKISIIVPVYNSQNSLRRCIESLMAQDESVSEILLINDGSTDNSFKICKEYEARDARIHVIDKKNEGVSEARNTGLLYAKGEYIQFVDSDDFIEPDMCKTLMEEMEAKGADLCICGFHHLFAGKDVKKSCGDYICTMGYQEFAGEFIGLYQRGYLNMPWNKLYKKELITDYFDADLSLGEDLIFNLSYLENIKEKSPHPVIVTIPDPLYYYIQNPEARTLSSGVGQDKLALSACLCKNTLKFYNDVLERTGEEKEIHLRMVAEAMCELAESVLAENFKWKDFQTMVKYYYEDKYLKKINAQISGLPLDLSVLNYFFVRQDFRTMWFLCKLRKILVKVKRG